MLVAKNWPIGVVVDQDQFRTPSDRHRKTPGENHRDAQSQALWPGLAATECGQRPVHLADPPSHLSGRVCRDKAGHRRGWAFFPNSLAGKTHGNANYVHHASLCYTRYMPRSGITTSDQCPVWRRANLQTGRVGQFHRRGVGGVVWPTSGWRRWPADRLPFTDPAKAPYPIRRCRRTRYPTNPVNAALHQLVKSPEKIAEPRNCSINRRSKSSLSAALVNSPAGFAISTPSSLR